MFINTVVFGTDSFAVYPNSEKLVALKFHNMRT